MKHLALAAWALAAPALSQVSVAIASPAPGEQVAGTVVVSGTSTGLVNGRVSVSIDGGPFQPAQGTASWDFVWESATVADGAHTLRARAKECLTCTPAFAQVTVVVANGGAGTQEFTYASSVDGAALTSKIHVPAGHDPAGPPVPLVIHLHGGGGIGQISQDMAAQLDARGWIGIAPDGREWGLFGGACTWRRSAAYVNSPDPDVGPGEQDILDAIDWARAHHPIDDERVYLTGFSMGGRGTYVIGLKHPDLFAAIAPMGPASDMFEVWVRRTDPGDCKEGMTGGPPGTSPFVDTMHLVTSARFLLENAYNLPVFHAHGLLDGVASNDPAVSEYLHGWHMTSDTSFDGCHAAPDLCFGHTPTLSELAARHPDGYRWAHMFTPVGHVTDARWLTGTPVAPGIVGDEDPLAPGQYLGIYDFLARHTRVRVPDTIVYKTYEDEHRGAHWAEILTSAPWTTSPAGLRATRDVGNRALTVELSRAAEVAFDLVAAELVPDADAPLSVLLAPLAEPAFDPALDASGEASNPVVRLVAPGLRGATVLRDGQVLDPALVRLAGDWLELGPLALTGTHLLEVHVADSPCSGGPNSAGSVASLGHLGTASIARNDLVLRVEGATPGQFGLPFHGFSGLAAPLGDGTLCVGGSLHRSPAPVALDDAGQGLHAVDLSAAPAGAGPGAITAGATVHFQVWYRDPLGATGSNTSDALRVTFVP